MLSKLNELNPCKTDNIGKPIPDLGIKFYKTIARELDCPCCIGYRFLGVGLVIGLFIGLMV